MTQQLSSKRVDALMLLRHGTQPCGLTARSIVQTVEADLRHREANKELRRLRENGMASKAIGTLHRYAFHSSHLKGSSNPAEVIAKAIKGREKGIGSPEIGRARIYSDMDLLYEALELAKKSVSDGDNSALDTRPAMP